ncbi:hypothetical protein DCOP10_12037 [Armatimonadetes bacterium DC]|nr:hypothetical protein DCOP10_12037 [Armatimonadetes bacterium DC]
MRKWLLWIITITIGFWVQGASAQPNKSASAPLREQLLRQKAALQQQKEAILELARSSGEEERDKEAEDYLETRRLLQTDLPQAPLPPRGYVALVKVEAVRRVDSEVLRAYPGSRPELHYYAVQARVLKVWHKEWYNPHKPFRVRAGDVLPLLWVACKRLRDGREVVAEPIWQEGQVCLVYELVPLPKSGDYLSGAAYLSENLSDYWWVIDTPDCGRLPRWSAPDDVLYRAQLEISRWYLRAWEVVREPTLRVVSPPAELLQVLDEEAGYHQLPEERSVRLAWVKQRVQDKSLPLWKRQRALVYWFFAPEEKAARLKGEESGGQAYARQQAEYLGFLWGLSEPLLQAFGLRAMLRCYSGRMYQSSPEAFAVWLSALEPFLAQNRPVEVRREAAAVLCYCLVYPARWGTARERALAYAEEVRSQWEQESDRIVRAYLGSVWMEILLEDIDRQIVEIDRQLEGLKRAER